jgi:alkylhydroperoxidase/carboxymuconolactone decarboxylase family protein YurZ
MMGDVGDLQDIALHLQHRLSLLFGMSTPTAAQTGLDPKSHALVCLGVLHAVDAADATYQAYVSRAIAAGCTQSEVVGTLFAVATLVGEVRTVSCARPLALALGYDVDAAIDSNDPSTANNRMRYP